MELKSVSGLGCYVKDLDKTRSFYEALGFRIGNQDQRILTVYLNWFWMQFIAQDTETKDEFAAEASATVKGAGLYINIKVDNVDEFHEGVLAKGLKASSEPRNWPWGNREFAMRDPDGYKLVFFQKLK